jgi:hypothetical protein
MATVNLTSEMYNYQTQLTHEHIEPYGIPERVAWAAGLVGFGHIVANIEGFFEPSDSGAPALIVQVRAGSPDENAMTVIQFGELIDLCAFDPRRPDVWFLRTGRGKMLGHPQRSTDQTIYTHPLIWVQNHGLDLCFLNGREPAA